MIDILALSVTHALLVLVAIRLMARDELDSEGAPRTRFGTRRKIGLGTGEDASATEAEDRP